MLRVWSCSSGVEWPQFKVATVEPVDDEFVLHLKFIRPADVEIFQDKE